MDAGLVELAGPGGSARLDGLTGSGPVREEDAWRTWVDEVVASWAACLLCDPALAPGAVGVRVAYVGGGVRR